MITKSMFLDWQNQEITQQMYQDTAEAAEELASEVIVRRMSNPADDQYLKGFIRGVQAAREWSPTFVEIEDENNG